MIEKDSFEEALEILLAHAKSKEKEPKKPPAPRRRPNDLLSTLPTPFAAVKKP